jgi:hypothetical protein
MAYQSGTNKNLELSRLDLLKTIKWRVNHFHFSQISLRLDRTRQVHRDDIKHQGWLERFALPLSFFSANSMHKARYQRLYKGFRCEDRDNRGWKVGLSWPRLLHWFRNGGEFVRTERGHELWKRGGLWGRPRG